LVLEKKQPFGYDRLKITTMTKEEIALEALENIASPIAYLQAEAKKNGATLDGSKAIELSNDPSFLKQIAEKAMREINSL